mgnify:CR=1 FL=1
MATHQLSAPEIGFVDKRRTSDDADDSSSISAAAYAAFKDNDSLDAALITAGLTQKYIDSLTQNDKVYAARVYLDSGSF